MIFHCVWIIFAPTRSFIPFHCYWFGSTLSFCYDEFWTPIPVAITPLFGWELIEKVIKQVSSNGVSPPVHCLGIQGVPRGGKKRPQGLSLVPFSPPTTSVSDGTDKLLLIPASCHMVPLPRKVSDLHLPDNTSQPSPAHPPSPPLVNNETGFHFSTVQCTAVCRPALVI